MFYCLNIIYKLYTTYGKKNININYNKLIEYFNHYISIYKLKYSNKKYFQLEIDDLCKFFIKESSIKKVTLL